MSDRIRVLIADDHVILRKGLKLLLETEPEVEVVAEASDGEEAANKAAELRPDVTLMDLVMPRVDGIEAIRRIRESDPEARVLVLTSFSEDSKLFPAIEAGALGYVLKEASPVELVQAIRIVHEGRSYLSPAATHRLVRRMAGQAAGPDRETLTAREGQVLRLLADGLSNQEIADRMYISERTVTNYVSVILSKLHLTNRTQAALYALRMGLAQLDEG